MNQRFSLTTLQLQDEICQRIFYHALQSTILAHQATLPSPLQVLRVQAKWWGKNCYVLSLAEIRQIFAGVTLGVYQQIEKLYCASLPRSIETVHYMIAQMAQHSGGAAPTPEAIWAICVYLEGKRQIAQDVTISRVCTEWYLVTFEPKVPLLLERGRAIHPVITCIVSQCPRQVIAFQIAPSSKSSSHRSLVLYDAIVAKRRPHKDGAKGLVLTLPARLNCDSSPTPNCLDFCRRLQVEISEQPCPAWAIKGLSAFWEKAAPASFTLQQFTLQMERYIRLQWGSSPSQEREQHDNEFRDLTGYNRDPVEVFSNLLQLLPVRDVVIDDVGCLAYDGLHYNSPFSVFWKGQKVQLHQAREAEGYGWIKQNVNDVLCQVTAQELVRQDGTIRPNRPQR